MEKMLLKRIDGLHNGQAFLKNWKSNNTMLLFLLLWLICSLINCSDGKCRDEPARDCEAICNARGVNCTIRALVLLPNDDMYQASLMRVLPILKVAGQQIRAKSIIPTHIDFEWLAHDTKCDASLGVIKAMDGIIKQCAHVIFGPVCDYSLAAVSRITKYFNSQGTPLISVGGSTYDFEQKKTTCTDEFYMLLRTGMLSFETISELTINVMKRHRWTNSIFYYDRDGQRSVAGLHTCYLMMKSLGMKMRKENMTFSQFPFEPSVDINRTEEMRREIGNKHANFDALTCEQNTTCYIDYMEIYILANAGDILSEWSEQEIICSLLRVEELPHILASPY